MVFQRSKGGQKMFCLCGLTMLVRRRCIPLNSLCRFWVATLWCCRPCHFHLYRRQQNKPILGLTEPSRFKLGLEFFFILVADRFLTDSMLVRLELRE